MQRVKSGELKPQNPLHQHHMPLQKHSRPYDEAQLKVVHNFQCKCHGGNSHTKLKHDTLHARSNGAPLIDGWDYTGQTYAREDEKDPCTGICKGHIIQDMI